MKRAILVVSAGSAMLAALGRRAAETVGEIRDAAEVGPDTLRLLEAESPRNNESLAWRIRGVLGPRNDDTRAVIDLIDELCEELDRQPEPFAWCFTDVNGRPKELADDPKHKSPLDLRVYTPLYRKGDV